MYYSHSGSTRAVGEMIAQQLGADVEEIVDLRQRRGVLHFMASGFRAVTGRTTVIREPRLDPRAYDLVIVGTPVYSGSVSSPVLSYLGHHRGILPRVAFFLTGADPDNQQVFPKMMAAAGTEAIATLAVHTPTVAAGDHAKQVTAFCQTLVSALG